MGTIATISAASPESMYFSEIVTPPLPASSKHAPMISDVRQFAQLDLVIRPSQPLRRSRLPCDQAIAYMIMPANTNRAPAIKNGGIVSIENRMPRYVEPQIRYSAAKAMITSVLFGAAIEECGASLQL